MYLESVKIISQAARLKVEYLKRSFFLHHCQYFGWRVYRNRHSLDIFCRAPLDGANSIFLRTLMGICFGIALTLVVFAGAELFTGNNMFMTVGFFKREVSLTEVLKVWGFSWLGNLLGSLLLAYLVVNSGAISHAAAFIEKTSAIKMNLGAMQLFLRAVLCNWLVCLALWTSARAKSDTAKCILIFWCLFAFIACSLEHSIANMTLLSLSLFAPHTPDVSWLGYIRNLFYVTLGNIVEEPSSWGPLLYGYL